MSPTMPTDNQNSPHSKQARRTVAVFVGGTSGIGEATCGEFVRSVTKPKVYLIGRDQSRGSALINRLRALNSDADVVFIRTDVTLLSNVDEVCRSIADREGEVNLLFITANVLSLKGRDETPEGLDKMQNLQYYSRMRFVTQLLPHLRAASSMGNLASIVSVLGAGKEGKIFQDDLLLKENYSLQNCSGQAICMNSLAFQKLAHENPTVAFVHTYPGVVRGTNIMTGMGPIINTVSRIVFSVLRPFVTSPRKCAQIHLSAAMNSLPQVKQNQARIAPISPSARLGSDGKPLGENKNLSMYQTQGMAEKTWTHTLELFDSICK